jgi:hypothetical protein
VFKPNSAREAKDIVAALLSGPEEASLASSAPLATADDETASMDVDDDDDPDEADPAPVSQSTADKQRDFILSLAEPAPPSTTTAGSSAPPPDGPVRVLSAPYLDLLTPRDLAFLYKTVTADFPSQDSVSSFTTHYAVASAHFPPSTYERLLSPTFTFKSLFPRERVLLLKALCDMLLLTDRKIQQEIKVSQARKRGRSSIPGWGFDDDI